VIKVILRSASAAAVAMSDDEKQTCAEAQHTGPITLKDRKVYNSRLRRSTAFIKNGNLSLSLSEFLSQEIPVNHFPNSPTPSAVPALVLDLRLSLAVLWR
jgi:hypothetical protein